MSITKLHITYHNILKRNIGLSKYESTSATCAYTNTQCCQSTIRNLIFKFVCRLNNPEMITTFQLGGDAIGNVPPPTCLFVRDLILSQFSIYCCPSKCVCLRGSAPDPLGGLQRHPDPQLEKLGHKHRSFA